MISPATTDDLKPILDKSFFKLLGDVSDDSKNKIIEIMEFVYLKPGDILFEQNDEADGIYTLLSGKLEALVKNDDGSQKIVGRVNRSETVGEMALITKDRRSATIRCYRNSLLVKISNENFENLCYENPAFALNVSSIIVKRLKKSIGIKKKIELNSNLAFAAGDSHAETQKEIDAQILIFSKLKNAAIVNHELISSKFSIDEGSFDERILASFDHFFNDLEVLHDHVIVDLRGFSKELVDLLLNYVDKCAIFKHTENNHDLTNQERIIFKSKSYLIDKVWLILLHPMDTTIPEDTNQWLENRPCQMHLHQRIMSGKDRSRIFRYLTGRPNALVLGGGGAKGLAHMGIIKALEETEIPIDYISGTSMGSIIAVLYAIYQGSEKVVECTREIFMNNPTPLMDLNFVPKYSLYRGKKIDRILKKFVKKLNIEDLWIPFFCISSNITTPCMTIHKKGAVHTAVKASIAVPGLFPPVIIDDSLHVDGGIFNNIPIDVTMNQNVGNILAVRVDKEHPHIENDSTDNEITLPSFVSVFIKSTLANSDNHTQGLEKFVDLFFEPKVGHFGFLNWKAHDEIFEESYNYAIKLLKKDNYYERFIP